LNISHHNKIRQNSPAQILVLFAMVLPILILFVGIVIDFGFAYVTKTTLSKAVDAAALAGMRNISQGQTQAKAIALSAFNANYGSGLGRDFSPPVVNIQFTTDGNNNTTVNVNATAAINTSFIRLLSGYKVLNVSSGSQVTRPKLVMSLVLDRSGSMNLNGGAQALPSAVDNFLTYFDNTTDQIADVSFSSVASVDVPIQTNFLNPITVAVNKMRFGGATFSQAGLLDGLTQINSVATPVGEQVVKVVVFFTDGWANTVQNSLKCPQATTLNFGGCSPPEAAAGWCSGISFLNPVSGNAQTCGATSFPSQSTGTMEPLTPDSAGQINTSNDAIYRSLQVGESMRSQGIVIYSIGLGDKISQTFLQQIANDPASSTFNSSEPVGQAVFAPTANDLDAVFQTIASKILLRISQ
jgi:Flp pilus assembly protein TadG